jgi:hypothetical protein
MRTAFLKFLLFLLADNALAQKDSLKLRLVYEVPSQQVETPLNIRVDFISAKATTISFQDKLVYLLECDLDDIKLQAEVLEGSCFKPVPKSDCGLIPKLTQVKSNLIQLQQGDTSTYRSYIHLLDREKVYQKHKGFTGNYRFRLSRFYLENGQRKHIFSNWLYVNYP